MEKPGAVQEHRHNYLKKRKKDGKVFDLQGEEKIGTILSKYFNICEVSIDFVV